jgi:peptide/nickel transport system permease protein
VSVENVGVGQSGADLDNASNGTYSSVAHLSELDESWIRTGYRARWWIKFVRIGRTFRDPGVAVPAGLLLFIVLACFLGPIAFHIVNPDTGNFADYLKPIGTPGHILGTNELGNDELSRLLHGGQVSILVGVVATGLGFGVGVILGTTAGVFGGFVETVIMRFLDALFAFPGLILALAIASYLGPSVFHTMLAIGFFTVAGFGRIARGQTVRVRNFDYIVAARASGVSRFKIIFGHVLPNVLPPLISLAVFGIGGAMVAEAALSYLNLGIKIPEPSWGNLIQTGEAYVSGDPSLVYLPAACLFITVLAVTLLADGFRRRLALDR